MPPSRDKLTDALEPLQRRFLLPEDYQRLGVNIMDAATSISIIRKYDLAHEDNIVSWNRQDTGFSLHGKGNGWWLLAATRITEAGIKYSDLFAFGNKEIVPYGISKVAHDAVLTRTIPEVTPRRLLWLAREYGSYKRHEMAIKREEPQIPDRSVFRRSLETIGMLPDGIPGD